MLHRLAFAVALLASAPLLAEEAPPLAVPNCLQEAVGPAVAFAAEYRPGLDDPRDLGASAILAATLSYQCPARTAAGGLVPEGWQVALDAACADRTCALAPALLVRDFAGTFSGTQRDGTAARSLRLTETRGGRLVLTVRTRREGEGVAQTARYLLVPAAPASAEAPILAPAAAPI